MDKKVDGASLDAATEAARPLSRVIVLLFAAASGLAVANAYFAHPLLDVMADDLGLARSHAGLIVALTQVGYGLGLILLVPVGDLVDRRKLVAGQSLLSVVALVTIGLATSGAMLLAAMAVMGFLAVVTQAGRNSAASRSRPGGRRRANRTSAIHESTHSPRAIAAISRSRRQSTLSQRLVNPTKRVSHLSEQPYGGLRH